MSTPALAPHKRGFLPYFVGVLFVAAIIGGVWAIWFRDTTKPDLVAAAHANARGIGWMEHGETGYVKAIAEFEDASRLAPDWTPAKINLGIALLNTQQDAKLDRATKMFEAVLKKEPENIHAHYNLGLIHNHKGRMAEAHHHFSEVTRLDPNDPHAWFYRAYTHPTRDDSPEAKGFYAKALALNPYLNQARYALAGHNHEWDAAKSQAILDEHRLLDAAKLTSPLELMYTKSGRYGDTIGRAPTPPPEVGPVPMFGREADPRATLAEGTKWATATDLDPLAKLVRERFGGTIVRLDYDGNGKVDLFLCGAVVRNGQLRDLLLRNDGDGKFTDVSTAMGLTGPGSFGCAAADADNDGRTDLMLTGSNGVRLLHNDGGKKYVDVSATAGVATLKGVFLGSAWFDLDQDSDLDAFVARYADTPEAALARLKGENTGPGDVVQLINIGEAIPVEASEPRRPLTSKYQVVAAHAAFITKTPVVGIVTTDLDADQDVDLLLLADGGAPLVVQNDRLLRLRNGEPIHAGTGKWNGGLVVHANADEQPDLVLLSPDAKPVLLMSKSDHITTSTAGRFTEGTTDSPVLVQAQTIDLDLDGRLDIIGLSRDGKPVFLQNDGKGKLTHLAAAFGPTADQLANLNAVSAGHFTDDIHADLIAWTDTGLTLFRNNGNGYHAVQIELSGIRGANDDSRRSNADGIGVTVVALAGPVRAAVENTTLSAGLGQSRVPVTLGLAKNETADAIRLRWPDGVPQTELSIRADHRTQITETDRRPTSCPVLVTWDGTRFRYVTDFLGAGTMGELGADGTTRPPRPEEAVKIEAGWLAPKDGKFILKVAEPMDEVMYLDKLRLDVIDHPANVEVHPDERFATSGPAPTGELFAFRDRFTPLKAIDSRGQNVTETLRLRDGERVSGFRRRNWIGFAEDHFVELDFGGQLAALAKDRRVVMVLAGWIEYPFPETIFGAAQAGVPMTAPILERQTADGKWEQVADLGFPAGLPRVMTRELPGLAGAKGLKLRLRTNLQIYWDQIYLAPVDAPVAAVPLPVSRATLAQRGFMQEVSPGRRKPAEYNDDRTEPVAVNKWRGKLTRTGDVTPLLAKQDDQFVIVGPADEVTVEFDTTQLPPVKAGHVRSFVLRTHGYVKDVAPFTATGGDIGPLPFRAMTSYPNGAFDRSKAPPEQEKYDREWNTRPAGR